ncbi:MAG: nucleoside hydrolase [Cyclobacteriaceae bacterium]|nr:nucleoside hydrolase [Cyclobacteriaceae bacterium]
MNRRIFLSRLGNSMLALPLVGALTGTKLQPQFKSMIIDADTANEIDDLYAITRALLEPGFRIHALSSAQWKHHLSPENTVWESQKINEDILRLLDRQDIPSPLGADMIVGKPWGGSEPSNSPAAQFIIQSAKKTKPGEKLTVVSLGALTNIASAILLAPEIIPKVDCYCLSGKYFANRKVWDKDEFNARRDLNALNTAFNTDGLDLHVMPVNILYEFRFRQEEVLEKLAGKGGIWDYLAARWLSHSPQNMEWIMWDLALIEALAHPEFTKQEEVLTPPENIQRKIHVYTSIDRDAMLKDWWETVEKEFDR